MPRWLKDLLACSRFPPASPSRPLSPLFLLSLCCACLTGQALADEVQVAVASNFAGPMERIAAAFARDTGHRALVSSGATGKLYAQIKHGAPFGLFLSADARTAARLEAEGEAIPGSRFTYAFGHLVLWSTQEGTVDDQGAVLRTGDFGHLAIANPKTAPYGAAAIEVLSRLDLLDKLQPRFVTGENIGQAHQFVASGNAALGFVALSQVVVDGQLTGGSAWLVPSNLYSPIQQDAVILKQAADNPAAHALAEYLKGDAARGIMLTHGYSFAEGAGLCLRGSTLQPSC